MTIVLTIVAIIAVVVGALFGVLVWQARVNPYISEELFVEPPHEGADSWRYVPLEGATNVRDIGGYTTVDGRTVRKGLLYRAARLDELTDADLNTLAELGITTVCDFRTQVEVDEMPDRVPGGATYIHMPVFTDDPVGRWRVLFNRHRLLDLFAEVYVEHIVEGGAPVYADLIRMIADEDALPLLFHCTAGKDRTGVAAALILMALGVDRQTATHDYLMTNYAAQTFIDEVAHQLGARNVRAVTVEQLYPLLAAAPALLNAALDHIETEYGTVEAYLLTRAGLSEATLTRLREVLLTGE